MGADGIDGVDGDPSARPCLKIDTQQRDEPGFWRAVVHA